ncbi:MAG: Hydrogenase 2 maturation protease [Phycisphaerae bacterium]|nr:Hydrogenase 2 maturation protease [Phycisphaerae bacterium]
MTTRSCNLLLGVGNVLRRDDGVGVYAARRVRGHALAGRLDVCEAGACGFEAGATLAGRHRVVVVDAIDAGLTPGAIVVLRTDELRPAIRTGVSLHDAHVLDALAETRLLGCAPGRVRFVAVQVCDVSAGIGLSPPVAAAVPGVVRVALNELGLGWLWRGWIAEASPAARVSCGDSVPRAEGFSWN